MAERKLYRSRTNRILFGVAGGLSEYFQVDPTIIRIIFILLTVWGGAGVLIYIICLFIMPEQPKDKEPDKAEDKPDKPEKPQPTASEVKPSVAPSRISLRPEQVFGIIVTLIGLFFLIQMFAPWFRIGKLWPLILVFIGLIILFNASKEQK